MNTTAPAPGTDLGHDVRLSLWAALGVIEVYTRKARTNIAEGVNPQANARRLTQLEKRASDLWDALADAQSL